MTNGYKISGETVFDMSPGSGFGTSAGGNEHNCNRACGSGVGVASGYGRGEAVGWGYNRGKGGVSDKVPVLQDAGHVAGQGSGMGNGYGSGAACTGRGVGDGAPDRYGFYQHHLSGTGFGASVGSGVGHPRSVAEKEGWVSRRKRASKR